MTDKQLMCVSCHKSISNVRGSVQFKCPSCAKYDIIRCAPCRTFAAKYKCPQCGFEGPN